MILAVSNAIVTRFTKRFANCSYPRTNPYHRDAVSYDPLQQQRRSFPSFFVILANRMFLLDNRHAPFAIDNHNHVEQMIFFRA